MRRMTMFMMIAAMLMISGAQSTGQELRREGSLYVAEITKSFKVQANGQLRMRRVRGDVNVQAWTNSEVLIKQFLRFDVYTEGEAKRALEEAKSSYAQTGDIIDVSGATSREWIDSRFTISAPKDFRIDISTEGGDISVTEMKNETKLNTSGGDIDLITVGGPVRATTSGGDITVRSSTGEVDLRTSGGDLTLENILGFLRGSTSGGDIALTGAKKDVDLRTSGGDIDIRDVSGRLDASTSGGNIDVEKCTGEVEVSTSGGDVTVRNTGGNTRASTSGGDIEVYNINGSITANTSGGDLELRDVRGAIDGSTSGGDVVATLTLTDFSKPHPVSLRSSGGNITLSIPEKMPATIRAEIVMDRGAWGSFERYEIISDFPLTISKDSEGRRERIHGEGSINGGGDLIDVSTSAGNIEIRKARP